MKIIVEDLWKSYGKEPVFQGFSAELPLGEITVLMGKSGCGKTTLTRILLGLERADGGRVSGVPEKKSAVFQEDRLFEPFGAVSNIRAALGKKRTDEEIRENLEAVLPALEHGLRMLLGGPANCFRGTASDEEAEASFEVWGGSPQGQISHGLE